jgi:hypothetical protein
MEKDWLRRCFHHETGISHEQRSHSSSFDDHSVDFNFYKEVQAFSCYPWLKDKLSLSRTKLTRRLRLRHTGHRARFRAASALGALIE